MYLCSTVHLGTLKKGHGLAREKRALSKAFRTLDDLSIACELLSIIVTFGCETTWNRRTAIGQEPSTLVAGPPRFICALL
jgi:hypothetical protein